MKIFLLTCLCMGLLLILAHLVNVLGYPNGLAFAGGLFVGCLVVYLYEVMLR